MDDNMNQNNIKIANVVVVTKTFGPKDKNPITANIIPSTTKSGFESVPLGNFMASTIRKIPDTVSSAAIKIPKVTNDSTGFTKNVIETIMLKTPDKNNEIRVQNVLFISALSFSLIRIFNHMYNRIVP